jgi:hypothetical protein
MKKAFFSLCLMLILFSCKKANQIDTVQSEKFVTTAQQKVKQYLDLHKKENSLEVNNNLEELFAVTDFSQLHIEPYDNKEDIWVAPVSINYNLIGGKPSNGNAKLYYILFVDKSGNIRTGKLVKYLPNSLSEKSDANTIFHDFYNFSPNLNATYEFFNPTRNMIEAFDYKKGLMFSHSYAQIKRKQVNNDNRFIYSVNGDCETYTIVTDVYDAASNLLGSIVNYTITLCGAGPHFWISVLIPATSPIPQTVFDEDRDPRSLVVTREWNLNSPIRGLGSDLGVWSLTFQTHFRGIKDINTPSNNYFYYTVANSNQVGFTSQDPNLYWEGNTQSQIVNVTTVNQNVIGRVARDVPSAEWYVGTTTTPFVKVFTFNQVFP